MDGFQKCKFDDFVPSRIVLIFPKEKTISCRGIISILYSKQDSGARSDQEIFWIRHVVDVGRSSCDIPRIGFGPGAKPFLQSVFFLAKDGKRYWMSSDG